MHDYDFKMIFSYTADWRILKLPFYSLWKVKLTHKTVLTFKTTFVLFKKRHPTKYILKKEKIE